MISQNPYSNCMSARLYYHDFLREESKKAIPESTLHHIINCPDCQAEICRLESLLVNADKRLEDQQSRRNSAITTLLKFHFTHVGEPVTCNTIKPFLASLADPVLEIRVLTPVTKHVDECQRCRADLQALQNLHLTHKQLCRLGQFLADKPAEDTVSCSQARKAIPSVASMIFRDTNAEVLKHLSTCPDCWKELFLRREELRRTLPDSGTEQEKIPCEAVSPSDIYDYALPYGIDPADDEYAEFREPLASHLGGCPTCLAKVQELQKTIYAIAERPESDVVTIYHVDEPVPAGTEMTADHAPSGSSIKLTARWKRRLSSPKVKSGLKISAAAAVIVVGLLLVPHGSTVTANLYDQMGTAINNARNIYVTNTTFLSNNAELTRETWISQSMSLQMQKNMKEYILSDFENKLEKTRELGSDLVVEKDLPENTLATIKRSLAGHLNLLPFARMSEAPKGTIWDPVEDDDLVLVDKNSEAYDLVWMDKTYGGSLTYYRRRFFIDPETNLPNKIEFYGKSSDKEEYTLQSKMVIKFFDDNKMQAAVNDAFP